ncbi:hypothetical protein hamaS1_25350 [Moorella sp. Hama-1]|uniref:TIM-barrel domain-containing protein n=2 Tax=Moorella sp. Hama-1 TaxID=2138101 RepID=UPI00204EB2CE|nr:TIM-barrel domain-containing protein [Moorella sp. Hama-1]BCV22466.1 hypothetical protein hamaS1_25350 [Moorella sp. Hama-1]
MQEQLTVDRNMQLGGLTTPYKAESGLEFIEKVIACNIEGKDVILNVETTNGEKSAVILRGYISGIVQVTLVPQGEVVAGRFSLVKNKAEQVAPVLRENEGQVCIDYNNFKLIINKAPWEMTCLNNDDNLILKEHRSDTDLYGNRRVKWLGYQRTNGGVSKVFNAFYAAYDEHFYGTGEKFIPLDKRGARIENWNFNTWGSTNERSYKNIPFFMSTRGYGLFIDTTCRTKFDFASGLESSISLTIEAEDTILDYYIILGPEFPSIIEKYTEMTGRAVVPPKWSFGLWMSRFGYRSRKEVEEVVSKLREYVIPADVIHLDPYWMKDRMYADLIWDEEAFPNPEEMIKNLKNMGFHVCLWVHPWIPKDSPVFKEAAEKGYFAKRKDETTYIFIPTIPGDKPNPCGIVDFSNPEARAWYKKRLKELIAMGVRAFKTDFGEAIPEDACFYEGSGRYIHNKYPLLYNSLFYEAFAECGVQGLVWQRSGWAGIQNWPVSWSGDMLCNFPSFVCTIWGGLNYALSGVPFWSSHSAPCEQLKMIFRCRRK